jgi:SAM-dependent methyltransferase
MTAYRCLLLLALCAISLCALSAISAPLTVPSPDKFTADEAAKFNAQAKGALAPVYPALADFLVARYTLAEKPGIGIDLGSGPGDLLIALCKRTKAFYWINADINPYNFSYFYADAAQAKVTHRVGAVFADAHALPFKDNYADLIVSRGTFLFWEEKNVAFAEIYRVLKPGGVALIGRGFSPNLPTATAAEIRRQHGDGGPQYDVAATAAELTGIMKALAITDYQIIIPNKPDTDVKYGIWVEFRKTIPEKKVP